MLFAISWITQLVTVLLTTANDYTWFVTDPLAHFALAQTDCNWLSPQCLQDARVAHRNLVDEHLEYYWCKRNEEAEQLEQERLAKAAEEQRIAEIHAKAEKWDRWEVSPPTVIVNSFNTNINNFINPTFISTCTPPPEGPAAVARRLAIDSRFTEAETTFWNDPFKMALCWIASIILFYKLVSLISTIVWSLIKRRLPGPPRPSSQHLHVAQPTPSPREVRVAGSAPGGLKFNPRAFGTPQTLSWLPKKGHFSSPLATTPVSRPANDAAIAVARDLGFLPLPAEGGSITGEADDDDASQPPASPPSSPLLPPLPPSPLPSHPSSPSSPSSPSAQEPERPLESSTGTAELAMTPAEAVEAAPVQEEAKKPERKIAPVRRRRAAAPRPAAPKPSGTSFLLGLLDEAKNGEPGEIGKWTG